MFEEAHEQGRILQAIIVMRTKESRSVAGIATVADVPALVRSLRPKRRD